MNKTDVLFDILWLFLLYNMAAFVQFDLSSQPHTDLPAALRL